MLNIVIPMAGRGSRFANAGFKDPKPLIQVRGRPMIQWVVENTKPSRPHRYTFICLAEHLARYPDIELTLRQIAPGCNVVAIEGVTEGAACTVLLARAHINNGDPLMIANADQYVDTDINEYLASMDKSAADGLIMTFHASDPKWSYCRMDSAGNVTEVVEKRVVSNEATVGIYNFSRGSDFVSAADEMIRANIRTNGEFYVAPAYNVLIARKAKIAVCNIDSGRRGMYGLGTPEDLQDFLDSGVWSRARSGR